MGLFVEKLSRVAQMNRSLLCVGLDPDPGMMPVKDVAAFNRAIVDATKDIVCAYKPNLAFYEALGLPGLRVLEATISHVRAQAPGVIILGDAKRGDIGSTNTYYARALFEVWGFDAATVNAYAGGESMEPFLSYPDRGVFIWCRSSNPGARDFQDIKVQVDGKSPHFYEVVARHAALWNTRGNVGLVVGATYPEELKNVRRLCPGMPVLVPGVGAQSGDLEAAVRAGLDSERRHNMLISSSRGVLYASRGEATFADAARVAALKLRDSINRILVEEERGWS